MRPAPRRRVGWSAIVAAVTVAGMGCRAPAVHVAGRGDVGDVLATSRALAAEGRRLDRRGAEAAVDRFYLAAVNAAAALDDPEHARRHEARLLYNEALGDALDAARRHGRIDPRSRLRVVGPSGPVDVPIAHVGFVWRPEDFHALLDPRKAPRERRSLRGRGPTSRPHERDGLGAPRVVRRCNPRRDAADRFLKAETDFPATAVLRPDLDAWLGRADRPPADVLELHDPFRVERVAVGAGSCPLAADFAAPYAFERAAFNEPTEFATPGLLDPGSVLERSGLTFAEPYQPGKTPLVLIHGINADQYMYSDLVADLRARPGFHERFQVAYFNYPSGLAFLRTAARLRRDLLALRATFDPAGVDPGLNDLALFGYSIGGLLAELQAVSGGEALWGLTARVPFERVRASDADRAALAETFFFEPVQGVRHIIFLATPHDGSNWNGRALARLVRGRVRQPEALRAMIARLRRDNPAAFTSIDALGLSWLDVQTVATEYLAAIRALPTGPGVLRHTILGAAHRGPLMGPKGDFIVPIESASIEDAITELRLDAGHLNIVPDPRTAAEVGRILEEY
jgi:hypothetical protein